MTKFPPNPKHVKLRTSHLTYMRPDMSHLLYTLDMSNLDELNKDTAQHSVSALESGQVIFCPRYTFAIDQTEQSILSETVLHPKHKNISYDYQKNHIAGINPSSPASHDLMSSFMRRYAEYSKELVETLIPQYSKDLIWGRTSYRPAEIKNRKTSPRKDDTRLHVDAFPSTPVNGLRILRIFCNVNPHNKPRYWMLGEPFSKVVDQFLPSIPRYSPTQAKILKWVKATKSLRSAYDHYMLHLHDRMKLDKNYQNNIPKQPVDFPSQSTWMVFTDQVSHAALGGQYLLEQTFYLPVEAMKNPELSPLKQLETKVQTI